MPTAGGHEDSSAAAGFGQSSQSFYTNRAAPRGGPRNARGVMNGYRASSNGFRGISVIILLPDSLMSLIPQV